jgi:DNA repair protein RadC
MTDSKKQQHYLGHRQRVKKHFLNIASEQAEDSELLEIMLFMMYSRKDVKPLVKKILHNFGNLRRFFAATKNGIQNAFDRDTKYEPCSQETIENIYFLAKLMKESTLRMTKQRMDDPSGTIFHNFDETIVYLQQKFGNLLQEHFTVIFLNAGNRIIDILTVAIGTIDEVRVYDREIVTKAISIGCVGIILVHNHFSGNPEASQADKDLTLQVAEACDRFQIKVLDHIIITNNKYFSFKENGLQLSHMKHEN